MARPDASGRDAVALQVVAALLNHPRHSLRAALVGEHAVADLHVAVQVSPGVPPHLASSSLIPSVIRAQTVQFVLGRVLEQLATDGPAPEALDAAKRTLRLNDRIASQSVAEIARELGDWELMVGLPAYGEAVRTAIEAVDAEGVQRVTGTWLRPLGRNRVKVVITPTDSADVTGGDEPAIPITDVPPRVDVLANGLTMIHRFVPTGLANARRSVLVADNRLMANRVGPRKCWRDSSLRVRKDAWAKTSVANSTVPACVCRLLAMFTRYTST